MPAGPLKVVFAPAWHSVATGVARRRRVWLVVYQDVGTVVPCGVGLGISPDFSPHFVVVVAGNLGVLPASLALMGEDIHDL